MSDNSKDKTPYPPSLEGFLLKVFSEKRLLELLIVLIQLGIDDPDELRRMFFNWKYDLNRKKVKAIELVANGYTRQVVADELQKDTKTINRWLNESMKDLGVFSKEQVISIAGSYGIGQKDKK